MLARDAVGAGGLVAPAWFSALIASGQRAALLEGYALGGGLMLIAAGVAARLGVAAERRGLEELAPPLSEVPK